MRLLLITPVRNEADTIEQVVEAVASQTLPPSRWVIIDDGSTDGTLDLAAKAVRHLPYASAVPAPHPSEGLGSGSEAKAFAWGAERAGWRSYDLIGKLDGDVVLPPEYFASLIAVLERNPTVGIVGGRLVEKHRSGERLISIPPHHVHGALKLYTCSCYRAIGGMPTTLGWDSIDEALAHMNGFETRSVDACVAIHLRVWGTRYGALRGRLLFGRAAYVSHYPAEWVVARSLKSAGRPPFVLGSMAELFGYFAAAVTLQSQFPDPSLRRHVRRELRVRLRRGALQARNQVRRRVALWRTLADRNVRDGETETPMREFPIGDGHG